MKDTTTTDNTQQELDDELLSLREAMDSYLRHLKIERNLAKNTILAYKRDLAQFETSCEGQDLGEDITEIEDTHIKFSNQCLASRDEPQRSSWNQPNFSDGPISFESDC